jgi:hydroxymethylbilane synthase
MPRTFVIGTRGSRLALRQVEIVRDALLAAHPGVAFDVHEIKTEGDISTAPLSVIGGTGVFTKAIEDALLAGGIDIAVHSLKDLPPRLASGLTIAAVPERGDPRDALVTRDGRTLADLPFGARIGTGSARRAVQLRALRPDIEPGEIRGNVDTRIRKVDLGDYDGAVLALAGLQRLGLEAKTAQIFSVHEMLPAVGQACLGVQVRADDTQAVELARALDHAPSRVAAECERAFLARLGAGCQLPVGAYAAFEEGDLRVLGMMAVGNPPHILRAEAIGAVADGEAVGIGIAEALIVQAGAEFSAAAS